MAAAMSDAWAELADCAQRALWFESEVADAVCVLETWRHGSPWAERMPHLAGLDEDEVIKARSGLRGFDEFAVACVECFAELLND